MLLVRGALGAEPMQGDAAPDAAQAAHEAFPQDHGLAVAAGRAWASAGRWEAAARAFRVAYALSGSAADRRDLAWSALRAGRVREASRLLRVTLDDPTTDAALARESRVGLRLGRWTGRPGRILAWGSWSAAPGSDALDQTWTVGVAGRWVGDDGALGQLGARYSATSGVPPVAPPAEASVAAQQGRGPDNDAGQQGLGTTSAGRGRLRGPVRGAEALFASDEVQLTGGGGFASPGWAVVGDGIVVVDGSGGFGGAGGRVLGRVRLLGDLVVSAGWTHWVDVEVGEAAVAWQVPVHRHLSLTPRLAGQLVGGTPLGMASLHVAVGDDRVGGWFGGRYGLAFRPVAADPVQIADLPGTLAWGTWAGLRIGFLGPVRLDLGYALDALEVEEGTALLHGLTVRVAVVP